MRSRAEEPLVIGEVARRAGISVSAVRFYADKGLIHAERSSGRTRWFQRHTLRRIAFIQAGQAVGIGLSEIGEALATLPHDRAPSTQDWRRLAPQWRRMLDQRAALIADLQTRLSECIGCGCLSVESCTLLNPADRLAHDGAGARLLGSADGGARGRSSSGRGT